MRDTGRQSLPLACAARMPAIWLPGRSVSGTCEGSFHRDGGVTLLLADFVTFNQISRDVRLGGDRAGRFEEEPGMYSVGSGMVLAIGDPAGATVVTLLAAPEDVATLLDVGTAVYG
jgi:hypothetical protein